MVIFCFWACTTSPAPVVLSNHDPVQYGTPFQHVPSTTDIVMYEINPGAMSQSGNFNGITSRLDSIKSLGINTIWLMPIFPVGVLKSFGSPYCVMNYTKVNPNYGTLDDFRNLVSEAHNRNIAVIIDWVGNHTSWDNPWMDNKSWYTRDVNGNIISPAGTNWKDVADLNYNNPDMRSAMIKAMKFWTLTANIDGFRCDAADYIPFDFWKQAIDTLENMKGRTFILLAEGSRADHFTAGFQMNYAWDFLSTLKNVFQFGNPASQIFTTNTAEYSTVPANKRKLRFTTNHDESNIATPMQLFNGKQGALAASVLTICLQGVPLLYCGQEAGVSNKLVYSSQSPINWNSNMDMEISYRDILGFYNSSIALRTGSLLTYGDADVITFTKTYLNENVLVIVNCRNKNVEYAVPTLLKNSSWTNALNNTTLSMGTVLSLQPYQFIIAKK